MRGKLAIITSLLGAIVASFVVVFAAPLASAQSFNLSISDGADSARGVDQAADLFGATGIFTTITNVLLFVVGAISVIMVIIGGLRYIISGGNTANVTTAKNTVLYAIIGIVVALFAYAIVNFVLSSFAPGAVGEGGTNV
jgi:hypothetical protein